MIKIINFISLILIAALVPHGASAQLNIINQFGVGGDGNSNFNDLISSPDGGFYLINSTSSSGVSGSYNVDTYGSNYIVLTKFDSSLIIEWQQSYGGNNFEDNGRLIILSDGLLLCSHSSSSISGNKSIASFGDSDGWMLKLDFNGNIVWQSGYGGNQFDGLVSLNGYSNNYIMAYASLSDISGNRSALKKGGQDFWVVKTDDLGGIIWDASYGSDGDDVLFGMECLSDGTIILAGTSIGANISFDKTEPPFSSSDAWVIAIDEDGNKLWDKTIGGSGVESSGGLIVIEDTIYLAVSSTSGISGLRNEPLKGNKDVWLTKLDKSGNIINMNFYGGDNSETVLGLSSIQNNTVLIHTRSNSDSSIDKSENSRGILDTWLIAIDTEGNIIGDKTVGGNEVDLHSKLINFQSNLLLGGISLSDVSGDKTIPKFNSDPSFFDVWLVELDATILDVIQTIDITPSVYPNPVNDFLTINLSEFSSVSKVDVYDYQGKLLLSRDLSNTPNPTTLQIDMSAFSSGMYTIRVYGDNVVRAVKVVK